MGILADKQWSGDTRCTVFAKTQSGFIYKLAEFGIDYKSQDGIASDGKRNMEDGKRYNTHFGNNKTGLKPIVV
jgi:hypothetical protein